MKHASKSVKYWHWIMENFRPKFAYLKGSANSLANSLSYLDTGAKVAQALYYLEGKDITFKQLNYIEQA